MGIQSTGVGSGLDVNSIISQLMAIEQRPLQQMQKQASTVQSQLSVFGGLQSRVTSLGDLSTQLAKASTWARTTATSSDASSVGVTATEGALPIDLRVEVSALAQGQSISTATLATSTTAVGTGTLQIELGSWSSGFGAFTPKSPASSVSITIGSADQTLTGIRDKINGANAGVVATILNDASGARLVLRSKDTGAESGFRITAADDDGTPTNATGLSAIAFNPPAGTATSGNQRATNLAATVNGAPVSAVSNTLTNIVDGVSLQVSRTTTAPVSVSVASDTAGIKSVIQQFVAAYNDTNKYLTEQTRYDPDTKTAGLLQGDRLAVGLQGQLRAVIGASSSATSAFSRLSDIGLELQRDGSLKLNETKLTSAFGKLGELAKLFGREDTVTPANQGIAQRLAALAKGNAGTGGVIDSREDSLRDRLRSNETAQDRFNDRLAQVEARLRAQYTALDRKMNELNGLNAYVTQQITLLNKQNTSSR